MEVLLGWLLKQTPIIVVLGVIIWWLQNRLNKVEDEKKQLQKEMADFNKDMLQNFGALESLQKRLGEDSKEDASTKQLILQKLTEIKTIVSTILYNENQRK
jgi:hypothetical protein